VGLLRAIPANGSESRHSSLSVLIADDDEGVRAALAALIRLQSDLRLADVVADADAAIVVATAERPDVAILDVRMPRGGGAWAASEIRRHSPETRVIALSGDSDARTRVEMEEAGAVGYLVKGSSNGTILEAIRSAARAQAYAGPARALPKTAV
jgi:DNA-binding NarL/FixJ family response regulator